MIKIVLRESKSYPTIDEIKRIIGMLSKPNTLHQFLNKFGQLIGRGSSRVVYGVGDSVFKLAINDAGFTQNKKEVIYSKVFGNYAPKILDSHKDGYWIESERVKTLETDYSEELRVYLVDAEHLLGEFLSYPTTEKIIKKFYPTIKAGKMKAINAPVDVTSVVQAVRADFTLEETLYLMNFAEVFRKTNVGDFQSHNLGIRPGSGEILIVDLGWDSDTYVQHYQHQHGPKVDQLYIANQINSPNTTTQDIVSRIDKKIGIKERILESLEMLSPQDKAKAVLLFNKAKEKELRAMQAYEKGDQISAERLDTEYDSLMSDLEYFLSDIDDFEHPEGDDINGPFGPKVRNFDENEFAQEMAQLYFEEITGLISNEDYIERLKGLAYEYYPGKEYDFDMLDEIAEDAYIEVKNRRKRYNARK